MKHFIQLGSTLDLKEAISISELKHFKDSGKGYITLEFKNGLYTAIADSDGKVMDQLMKITIKSRQS